jgi:ParB family transcriptional regulator, chromosome partitioning protein
MTLEVALQTRPDLASGVRPSRNESGRERGLRTIVSVSPFRCRIWGLHDRMDDYLTEESCSQEIESFKSHGQLVPVLGRPLPGDREHDVEIIYGARRLFVARNLGVPLQVEIRNMSDKEAAVAMDIENRHRKNTSPYERGISYKRWLQAKLFGSQEEIGQALNVSASQVSRMLQIAQLPSVILNAFESPLELRESWGLDLYKLWCNQETKPLLAQRARSLAERTPRPSAPEVYQHLIAPSGAKPRSKRKQRDEVVMGNTGAPLFRIRRRNQSVVFVINLSSASPSFIDAARQSLTEVLQNEIA